MGNNRAEYERRLKEKLARRQKRIEQGTYICFGKLLYISIWRFLKFEDEDILSIHNRIKSR